MAAGAGVMLKTGAGQTAPALAIPQMGQGTGPAALLASLKDELFAIETDRLEGRLGDAEYSEQKAALEIVLKRALSRRGESAAAKPAESGL
jgi:hypothetical protein